MNKGIVVAVILVLGVGLVGALWYMGRGGGYGKAGGKKGEELSMPVPVTTGSGVVETEVVSEPASESGSGEETVSNAKEFVVEGSPFKLAPAQIRVKKGDTVRVVFKNLEGQHSFVIDEFEVATDQIQSGEEEEVEFVADKAGTFDYYCSVGTHRKLGMVGKLIVE